MIALVALKEEEHKKLNHAEIDFQNWKSGIKEIKEQLGWKDSDFPKHIQKVIKERKEQTKINN